MYVLPGGKNLAHLSTATSHFNKCSSCVVSDINKKLDYMCCWRWGHWHKLIYRLDEFVYHRDKLMYHGYEFVYRWDKLIYHLDELIYHQQELVYHLHLAKHYFEGTKYNFVVIKFLDRLALWYYDIMVCRNEIIRGKEITQESEYFKDTK